jgi:phage shock protein A
MHPTLEAALAFPRERAAALLAEVSALRDLAADVGRYAAARLRSRYAGTRSGLDPFEMVLDEIILDVSNSLIEAKKNVAVAIADAHRLAKQTEQEQANAAEWARRAARADEAGDLGLATEARAREREHAASALTLHGLSTRQRAQVEALKTALRALNERVEHAKRDKNRIVAARRIASARDDMRETFRRMNDAVRLLERLAEMSAHIEETSAPPEGDGSLH